MCEIKESQRILPNGISITTYSREFTIANILSVEAGTTGHMGGDAGYGGRTYFRIEDIAGTDIDVHLIKDKRDELYGLEVILGGDSELDTIISALKFITRVLEDKAE